MCVASVLRRTTRRNDPSNNNTTEWGRAKKKIKPETFYGKEMIFKGASVLFTADTFKRLLSQRQRRESVQCVHCKHVFFILLFFHSPLFRQKKIDWDEVVAHGTAWIPMVIKRECIPSERTLNALFPLNESSLTVSSNVEKKNIRRFFLSFEHLIDVRCVYEQKEKEREREVGKNIASSGLG